MESRRPGEEEEEEEEEEEKGGRGQRGPLSPSSLPLSKITTSAGALDQQDEAERHLPVDGRGEGRGGGLLGSEEEEEDGTSWDWIGEEKARRKGRKEGRKKREG